MTTNKQREGYPRLTILILFLWLALFGIILDGGFRWLAHSFPVRDAKEPTVQSPPAAVDHPSQQKHIPPKSPSADVKDSSETKSPSDPSKGTSDGLEVTIEDINVVVPVVVFTIFALAAFWMLVRAGDILSILFVPGVLLQFSSSPAYSAIGLIILGIFGLVVMIRTSSQLVRRRLIPVLLLTGILGFFFAVAGTLERMESVSPPQGTWSESRSVALYEATQALMMNMAPHEPDVQDKLKDESASIKDQERDSHQILSKSNERIWFLLARLFAIVFAVVAIYKTLMSYGRTTMAQIRLVFLRCGFRKATLVCGLGDVGMKLVEDLVRENRTVIVIENDEKNKSLEAATDLGVIILNEDATQPGVLEQLPMNSINEIFVVCGDDAVNIEVSMALNMNCGRSDPKGGKPCFVQIQDSILLHELTRAFSLESTSSLKLRTFSADRNAVTQLITSELVAIRPKEENEVALYVVIGLDDRWEEVVYGLAQLAHFENRLRSRIVVLVSDPETAAKKLEARHPRFSSQPVFVSALSDVSFRSIDDDWESTFAGAESGRTEAVFREAALDPVKIPDGFVRLRIVCPVAQVMETVPPDGLIRARDRSGEPFRTRPSEKDHSPRINEANGGWMEVEGDGKQIKNWLCAVSKCGITIHLAEAFGREFATNTRISKLPVTPEAADFQRLLLKILMPQGVYDKIIVPVMIVAGRDDFQNFHWTELFLRAWTRFRAREGISPPVSSDENNDHFKSRAVGDFSVFVWNSGRKGIERILASGQPGLPKEPGGICSGAKTFGAYSDVAGLYRIRSYFRETLVSAIKLAYDYAVRLLEKEQEKETTNTIGSEDEPKMRTNLKGDPEEFDSGDSNFWAADHALVKFAMVKDLSGEDLKAGFESRVQEILAYEERRKQSRGKVDHVQSKQLEPPELVLNSGVTKNKDVIGLSAGQVEKLVRISQVEHNRWSAELLLRGAEWRLTEEKKLEIPSDKKKFRGYSQIHIRKTLCSWTQLKDSKDKTKQEQDQEQKKDINQVWYALYVYAGRKLFLEIWNERHDGPSV